MEKLIELGFVCQIVLNAGEVVSVSVRDARNGQLLFAGTSETAMASALLKCIDDASRSMDAQVKAIDNA